MNKNIKKENLIDFENSFLQLRKNRVPIKSYFSEPIQSYDFMKIRGVFENIQVHSGFKTKLLRLAQKFENLGIEIEKIEYHTVAFEVTARNDVLYDFLQQIQLEYDSENFDIMLKCVINYKNHNTLKIIKQTKEPFKSKNSSGDLNQISAGSIISSQKSQKMEENVEQKPKIEKVKSHLKRNVFSSQKPINFEGEKKNEMWLDKYIEKINEENKRFEKEKQKWEYEKKELKKSWEEERKSREYEKKEMKKSWEVERKSWEEERKSWEEERKSWEYEKKELKKSWEEQTKSEKQKWDQFQIEFKDLAKCILDEENIKEIKDKLVNFVLKH